MFFLGNFTSPAPLRMTPAFASWAHLTVSRKTEGGWKTFKSQLPSYKYLSLSVMEKKATQEAVISNRLLPSPQNSTLFFKNATELHPHLSSEATEAGEENAVIWRIHCPCHQPNYNYNPGQLWYMIIESMENPNSLRSRSKILLRRICPRGQNWKYGHCPSAHLPVPLLQATLIGL